MASIQQIPMFQVRQQQLTNDCMAVKTSLRWGAASSDSSTLLALHKDGRSRTGIYIGNWGNMDVSWGIATGMHSVHFIMFPDLSAYLILAIIW